MTTLTELVDPTFAVLFRDYGFVRKPSDEEGHVSYFKEPLLIDFWWGKGEIDVLVEVALSFTKDHKVFRAYISRTFELAELATRNDASALKPFHDLTRSWPEPVGRSPLPIGHLHFWRSQLQSCASTAGRFWKVTSRCSNKSLWSASVPDEA